MSTADDSPPPDAHRPVFAMPNLFANKIMIVQPWTVWPDLIPEAEDELCRGASDLGARKLRVFPVWPARVDGDVSSGKIPSLRDWPAKASTDAAVIQKWWRTAWNNGDRDVYVPGANIGIACGAASNLTVLDVDHRPDEGKDGPASLAGLVATHGPLPPGPVVCRGTSRHYYFKYVSSLRNSVGALPGLDLKNEGGYVVAPPSIHRTGMRYRWIAGTEHLPPPEMPMWLINALEAKQNAPKMRSARPPVAAASSKKRELIESLRARVAVSDVLAWYQLPAPPSPCPVHGGDHPTAFKTFESDTRWHCFTQCGHGGDVFDLVMEFEQCTFEAALDTVVTIADYLDGIDAHDAVDAVGQP